MTERWRRRRTRTAAAQRVLAEQDGARRPEPVASDDPELTRELQAMRGVASLLKDVPGEAWAAIPAPEAVGAGERGRLRGRVLAPTPGLAAAAVVVSLALGFLGGAVLTGGSGSSVVAHGPAVALRPLVGTPQQDLATAYMPGPGQMVLRVSHLPASPSGTYYELWLMSDAKRLAPVAAFRVGARGSAQLTLRLPDDPRHYVYLDISQQRVGGGTAHSSDSVLRGRIA